MNKYAESLKGLLKGRKKKEKKMPETFQEHVWSWTKTIVGAILVVMILNGLAIASFVVPTGSMENTVMTGDFLFVNKFVYGPSTPQVIPFLNIPLPFYKFPGFKDPKRGDVIVFIYPGDREEVKAKEFQYYLKRCIATAGDTLQIVNKKVFVNGKEVPMWPHARYDASVPIYDGDPWLTFPYGRSYNRDNYGPLVIPKKGDVVKISIQNYREWDVFLQREGHEVSLNGDVVTIDGKKAESFVVKRDYCFGLGDNRDHSLDSRYWGFIPYENVVGSPIVVYWSWNTNLPLASLGEKLSSIRWSRIFRTIN